MNILPFALVLATALRGGLCIGTEFNPENGTVVTREIGDVDVRFECTVVNDNGSQVTTQWNIENFGGQEGGQDIITALALDASVLDGTPNPGGFFSTYRNNLTFPVFLESMDETTLTCGFPGSLRTGQFFLRVYREPQLQDLPAPVRFIEGGNLIQSVEVNPPAHPFPTTFQWSKDVETPQNDSRSTFGYPSLTINPVQRTDNGAFSLTATNFFLDEVPAREFGTATGGFTLDVLYGPDIDRGDTERAVLFNESLTLECGRNLASNPPPTITWTDPAGSTVSDGDRVSTSVDEAGVRLDISGATGEDTGMWACLVVVEGENVTMEGGGVASSTVVGQFMNSINLTVVVTPGQPLNLSVVDLGATWAHLCWQAPSNEGEPGIARYNISATPPSGVEVTAVTVDMSDATRLNVSGLLPNVEYEFRVRAVAMALDVQSAGLFSESEIRTTGVTVPDPVCSSQKIPGGIRMMWQFVHTGGQNLTAVTVAYEIGTEVVENTVSVDQISTDFSPLLADGVYSLRLTATNMQGSTQINCSTVQPRTGIPGDPAVPVLEEMGGAVRVTMQTQISGIEQDGTFYFLITQTQTSTATATSTAPTSLMSRVDVTGYTDGDEVQYLATEVDMGESYTFLVKAGNRFGESGDSSAASITITDAEIISSSNAGAIAGGVIGGLIGAALIAVIVIILVFLFIKVSRSRSSKTLESSSSPVVKYAPAPTGVRVEEISEGSPDIGNELLAVEQPEKKELHYADLESFRPPPTATSPEQQQQQGTPPSIKPTQVEPVMYAVIDSFKKPPPKETKQASDTGLTADDKTGTSTTVV